MHRRCERQELGSATTVLHASAASCTVQLSNQVVQAAARNVQRCGAGGSWPCRRVLNASRAQRVAGREPVGQLPRGSWAARRDAHMP